ncbi:hypothetical protein ILYODFUR_036534 [Ilyodon furcidens]|uniref:Uncharacterized protein n=1 Tax=Ilyodon furcidens TaxID=33524 RepID=A0ABV0UZ81_9TELE
MISLGLELFDLKRLEIIKETESVFQQNCAWPTIQPRVCNCPFANISFSCSHDMHAPSTMLFNCFSSASCHHRMQNPKTLERGSVIQCYEKGVFEVEKKQEKT